MILAVVPARSFAAAKQRLAEAVPAEVRAALARAMLEDVLAALAAAGLDGVIVVTEDAEVARLAEARGARVIREDESAGHTAAVARGVAACLAAGATGMLTVPGDVPGLTAEEVRAVVAACPPPPAAVFVP